MGYALKADVRHYFDTVDHEVLLQIIGRKIKDNDVMRLIRRILDNHSSKQEGKGMPIGNLTSQFFANVYLNELDWFVKHQLKAKYYIRYVDDFVILHRDRALLMMWQSEIDSFLRQHLKVELHPEKTRIIPLRNGVTFLGFRIFNGYRLLKKSNFRRIWKRLDALGENYDGTDGYKEKAARSIDGWLAYARFANTHKLRMRVSHGFEDLFPAKPIL